MLLMKWIIFTASEAITIESAEALVFLVKNVPNDLLGAVVDLVHSPDLHHPIDGPTMAILQGHIFP